ncbi:MAG TPA: radical SAM protein [Marmoricola sp.]
MSSTPVRLADVVPFSWVDGPGNRFVVFTQGCPFDCLACHNPETIPPIGEGSHETHVDVLLRQIRLVEPYLEGVTVSGGEATAQWRFVRDFFTAIRDDVELDRLTTYVDTNGHALRRVWDELLPVTDGFMVDLKALDPDVHRRLTGRTNELVLDSIRHLHAHERLHEVRLLLVPGFNDTEDQLARTGEWLAALDPRLRVVVLGFRPHGVRAPWSLLPEMGPERLERAEKILRRAGLDHVVTV